MQRNTPGSSRDRLLGRRAPAAAGDPKLRDLGARPLPLQAPIVPIKRAARLPGVRHAGFEHVGIGAIIDRERDERGAHVVVGADAASRALVGRPSSNTCPSRRSRAPPALPRSLWRSRAIAVRAAEPDPELLTACVDSCRRPRSLRLSSHADSDGESPPRPRDARVLRRRQGQARWRSSRTTLDSACGPLADAFQARNRVPRLHRGPSRSPSRAQVG
jgi:hypothetical protein